MRSAGVCFFLSAGLAQSSPLRSLPSPVAMTGVSLVIKNLTGQDCLLENVPVTMTLKELRDLITTKHPLRPPAFEQTVRATELVVWPGTE